VEKEVIDNEVKVLTELCERGVHQHIVAVLRIGELRNTRCLFIDMELCDLNLADYIYCTKPRELVPTFFIRDQPPPMKVRQIWTTMLQVVRGVEYLHSRGIVHRDLKPANRSLHHPWSTLADNSFVFSQRRSLETSRFRFQHSCRFEIPWRHDKYTGHKWLLCSRVSHRRSAGV